MGAIRSYESIARNLRSFGFTTDKRHGLHVIRPLPDYKGKGFWIALVEKNWYVGTYLMVGYHIPKPEECLHHRRFRNSYFPKTLIKKYALRMIVGDEYWKVVGRPKEAKRSDRAVPREGKEEP